MKMRSNKTKDCKECSDSRNLLSVFIDKNKFIIGDVYLFHKTDPRCPANSSLWGMFDKSVDGAVFLESCSSDHEKFDTWCMLPEDYRYCRLTTRTELRQYILNQTWYESRRILKAEWQTKI